MNSVSYVRSRERVQAILATNPGRTQWDPLDFTLEEWLILRSGWFDPVGDRKHWEKAHKERKDSAAAISYRELGMQPQSLH